jgi:hypothetical protein
MVKLLKQTLARKCKRGPIDIMKWDLIPVYSWSLKSRLLIRLSLKCQWGVTKCLWTGIEYIEEINLLFGCGNEWNEPISKENDHVPDLINIEIRASFFLWRSHLRRRQKTSSFHIKTTDDLNFLGRWRCFLQRNTRKFNFDFVGLDAWRHLPYWGCKC